MCALLLLSACGTDTAEHAPTATTAVLAPSFSPLPTSGSHAPEDTAAPRVTTSPAPPEPERQAAPIAQPAGTTTPTPHRTPRPLTARATDTTNDVDWTLRRPPDYTDISAATLTRTATGFTLRVRFLADLPHRQPDDEHTMNVASFFDTTGDGEIDYEIWANLADNGWGPSYRDRRNSEARFMADSGVRMAADGASLVFRFPLTHLNRATTFQWATASEWGSYHTLSTPAAATDHAPNTGAAPFPG